MTTHVRDLDTARHQSFDDAFATLERVRAPRGHVPGPRASARARNAETSAVATDYRQLRDEVRGLVRESNNAVGVELLEAVFELETRIEADPTGEDPEWAIREAADNVGDLLRVFIEAEDRGAIQDPPAAIRFTLETMADVGQAELAELFGVDVRTIRTWQSGPPKVIRRHPDRVLLIGELVWILARSMTPRGVIQWFNRPRVSLGGRTPKAVIATDAGQARDLVLPLAQGGRAQLAS